MSGHKHHMIHGWIIGKKQLDWICDGCRKAWIPVKGIRGLWRMIDRDQM